MIPTPRGITVTIVALILYGMAWHMQIGWFYVADALVWAILLVNLPFPWLSLRGITVQRVFGTADEGAPDTPQPDIFEGDSLDIILRVHSRSLLPRYLLTLHEHCPIAPPDHRNIGFLIATLSPRSRTDVVYNVQGYQRGVHSFPTLELRTSAPFGLFRARRKLRAPLEILVYPQVLPMEETQPQGKLAGTLSRSGLPQTGGELRGSREYQIGDRLHNVHWRNSARRGRLMVKEFDETHMGDVRIAFNPNILHGQGKEDTLEYSVKIAASVAQTCFRDGRRFHLLDSASVAAPPTWHGLLERLARLQADSDAPVDPFPASPASTGISIAIVSAADANGLNILAHPRPGSANRIVGLLTGFDPNEQPGAADGLASASLAVVTVRRGHLPQDLEALATAMGRSITPHSIRTA